MKSESGLWRKMLYAVRDIAKGGPITSHHLANAVGLDVKTASAWLCILAKYGYLRRAGKETVGGRWGYVWELTLFGYEYRPRGKKLRPAPESAAQRELRIAANPGKKK